MEGVRFGLAISAIDGTLKVNPSIPVKSAPRFAAKPTGGDVLAQQRAGAIFRITEALVGNLWDVDTDIVPDEVGEF